MVRAGRSESQVGSRTVTPVHRKEERCPPIRGCGAISPSHPRAGDRKRRVQRTGLLFSFRLPFGSHEEGYEIAQFAVCQGKRKSGGHEG